MKWGFGFFRGFLVVCRCEVMRSLMNLWFVDWLGWLEGVIGIVKYDLGMIDLGLLIVFYI